ncbi:MFS transporter [Pseudonocardia zijingensis]|jgi:AAHS family benzoate transporter-like MFS transporter|uniref:Aromatic acid/H+ symport family MFS transporter n=1 Tax=Pseudonocardia zijingensis TaxID=153376 RepID=A0ABN1N862_9PSEU
MVAVTEPRAGASIVVRRTPVSIVAICTLLMIFEGYDIFSYGVVVPALLAHPGWALTPAYAGLIGSAGIFGMLVGALVVGVLTDRLGRKAMFVGAVALFSIGMALCAWAPTPEALLACRVLVGIGSGGFLPTALAFVVESTPAHRRNFVVAVVSSGVAVGGAVAAVLGAAVLPALGYRFVFLVGLLPLIVLVPIVVARVPESISYLVAAGRVDEARATVARHRLAIDIVDAPAGPAGGQPPSAFGAFASLFTREHLAATLVFWFGTAFCMVLIFGANTWLPAIMLAAGYGLTSSLGFLAALNLGVVVGSLITAWLADRRGPKMFVLIGFATCVLALLTLAHRPPAALTFLLVMLVGFGAGGTQNLINSYLAIYYGPEHRGTGVGAALAFGRIGGIVGPIYGGLVLAGDVSTAMHFYAFVVPAALALLTFALGPRVTVAEATP